MDQENNIPSRSAESAESKYKTSADSAEDYYKVMDTIRQIGTDLGMRDFDRLRGWYFRAAKKHGCEQLYRWAALSKEARNPAGYFNALVKNNT